MCCPIRRHLLCVSIPQHQAPSNAARTVVAPSHPPHCYAGHNGNCVSTAARASSTLGSDGHAGHDSDRVSETTTDVSCSPAPGSSCAANAVSDHSQPQPHQDVSAFHIGSPHIFQTEFQRLLPVPSPGTARLRQKPQPAPKLRPSRNKAAAAADVAAYLCLRVRRLQVFC